MSAPLPSAAPVLPALKLGAVAVDPPVILAPMAGVTNVAFRRLCRTFGAGLYVSEMITARALVEGNAKTLGMAAFGDDEPVRSVQLCGCRPGGDGGGGAPPGGRDRHRPHRPQLRLSRRPRSPDRGPEPPCRSPIGPCSAPSCAPPSTRPDRCPVTVKMRLGVDDGHLTYLEAGRIAEDEGVAASPSTPGRLSSSTRAPPTGRAIARLKEEVDPPFPVLGNGDIWEASDALAMVAATGCDGVVVGRGCLGRPWLFRDLADAFAGRPHQATARSWVRSWS